MIGLRSLRNRLAVVFGLIVLGAIGTIYLTVTPRLQDRLRNQKVERLAPGRPQQHRGHCRVREHLRAAARQGATARRRQVNQAAAGASAEVLILNNLGNPLSLVGKMDSVPDGGLDYEEVTPIALEAARTRRPVASTDAIPQRSLRRRRVSAHPAEGGRRRRGVRRPRSTRSRATSSLIRRQILLSGGIALVIALARRLSRGARAVRSASSGSSRRRARSRRATSRTRSAPTPMTSWASSRRRSTTCRTSSRGWTARASSSSPRRRTSCARRSSRSAASSSCSPTRTSTRRRGAQFLDQLRGQVDAHAQARDRAARPLAAGGGRARAASGADRRRPARARGGGGVHARRPAARLDRRRSSCRHDPIELDCDPERVAQVLRILLDNALRPHARRARVSGFRPPAGTGTFASRSPTADSASSARTCPTSSSRSSRPTRRPRAPASASRSPASWPSACRAG